MGTKARPVVRKDSYGTAREVTPEDIEELLKWVPSLKGKIHPGMWLVTVGDSISYMTADVFYTGYDFTDVSDE